MKNACAYKLRVSKYIKNQFNLKIFQDHTARQLAQANNHHNIVDIFDRCRPEREYSMDLHIQHTHQPQPSRKVTRAPKKQTSRSKKESASNSRDSTHLTPPPSDGSTSTPSPQHFMNTTHTTPTSLNYLSPEYQTEAGSSEAVSFKLQLNRRETM